MNLIEIQNKIISEKNKLRKKSKNVVNGCKAAKNKEFRSIITLTGHDKDNPVSKLGDVNFNVNSKAYNHIENAHQILLLSLVDLIIGKSEYLPN